MNGNTPFPNTDPFTAPGTVDPVLGTLNTWQLAGVMFFTPGGGCDPATPWNVVWETWRNNGGGPGTDLKLESITHTCVAVSELDRTAAPWSAWYTFTQTTGPYRVGVRQTVINALADPPFDTRTNATQEYMLFADEYTATNDSFAGLSLPTTYAVTPGSTPIQVGSLPALSFGANPYTVTGGVEFRNLTCDGRLVDTGQLHDHALLGDGGGAAHLDDSTLTGGSGSVTPWGTVTYDLDVTLDGGVSTNARITDSFVCLVQLKHDGITQKTPQADYLTMPYVATFSSLDITSWERDAKDPVGGYSFDLQAAWRLAYDPPQPAMDTIVPSFAAVPMLTPECSLPYVTADRASYAPANISVAGSLNVHGSSPRPSVYVATTGGVAVTDTGSGSVGFSVSTVNARAMRIFAGTGSNDGGATGWRNRVGAGTTPIDLGTITNYLDTRHQAGEDIWGWLLYAYLQVNFSGPGRAWLRIRGAHLSVFDPHTTGQNRADDYTATLVPFDYSYHVSAGAASIIDLMFPDKINDVAVTAAQVPVWLSRVDSLEWSFDSTGNYTLDGMVLTRQGRNPHLKHDLGIPGLRVDYGAGHVRCNGSLPNGYWGPGPSPGDESGPYGSAFPYAEQITGYPSGTISDTTYTLQEYINLWKLVEGVTVSYSQSASDAANKDIYGVSLPEYVMNIRPIAPFVESDNYSPPCNPCVRSITVCPGLNWLIYVRWPIGGGVGVQAKTSLATRAASGALLSVKRGDTGAVVDTRTTDADGFLEFRSIPANLEITD